MASTLNRELCRKRAAARPPNPAPITITVGVDDVADATATLTPHRLDSDVVLDSFEGAIDGAVPSAYYLPALKLQMSAEGDSKIHRHTCRSEANPDNRKIKNTREDLAISEARPGRRGKKESKTKQTEFSSSGSLLLLQARKPKPTLCRRRFFPNNKRRCTCNLDRNKKQQQTLQGQTLPRRAL